MPPVISCFLLLLVLVWMFVCAYACFVVGIFSRLWCISFLESRFWCCFFFFSFLWLCCFDDLTLYIICAALCSAVLLLLPNEFPHGDNKVVLYSPRCCVFLLCTLPASFSSSSWGRFRQRNKYVFDFFILFWREERIYAYVQSFFCWIVSFCDHWLSFQSIVCNICTTSFRRCSDGFRLFSRGRCIP